jgi:hypothetical protein
MPLLNLKASHNVVKNYYDTLKGITTLHLFHEGAVSPAFAALLRYCGRQYKWTLVEKSPLKRGNRTLYPDGTLFDDFKIPHGYWEAKDTEDDLAQEVRNKFATGYLLTVSGASESFVAEVAVSASFSDRFLSASVCRAVA